MKRTGDGQAISLLQRLFIGAMYFGFFGGGAILGIGVLLRGFDRSEWIGILLGTAVTGGCAYMVFAGLLGMARLRRKRGAGKTGG